ncbi:rhomboid family intramembrane serine protease [Bartonella sp. CB178]|uniref:rhomboid family intramembrane serine protease n=1 Tax=Bartonella sp. CB178 TaxID=3112255 RepID=UPI00300DF6CC
MRNTNHRYGSGFLSGKQQREWLLDVPSVVVALAIFCFCIHFISRYFLSDQLYSRIFGLFSFTPVSFKADPLFFFHTVISYSFMHGSFEHTAINMAWLLVFGSYLVNRFGNFRFLIFLALTAAVSALSYFFLHQDSAASLVGASGAISGMMGAAARFGLLSAHFNYGSQSGRHSRSLLFIKQEPRSRTMFVYVGVWLIGNFVVGIFNSLFEDGSAKIAWEARVGGLLSGFLLARFFDNSRRKEKIMV